MRRILDDYFIFCPSFSLIFHHFDIIFDLYLQAILLMLQVQHDYEQLSE